MGKKEFSTSDFLEALKSGELKDPVSIVGMVKLAEDKNDLLFSHGRSCQTWTKIPLDHVEKVEYLFSSPCKDHAHPVVRLFFKPQDGAAGFFLELLRASTDQPEGPQPRLPMQGVSLPGAGMAMAADGRRPFIQCVNQACPPGYVQGAVFDGMYDPTWCRFYAPGNYHWCNPV